MTDELRLHWSLHEIDEEAVRHEGERSKLPEQRRALETRLAAERRRLAALDQRASALQVKRRELEREIATLEAQERRYRQQLDAVTNQHQFEAVQHEIAGVAGRRSDFETETLQVMDDEERAAAERPALAEALAKTERETSEALVRLTAEEHRLGADLDALDARRAGVLAELPAASRSRYERIRASRGGRAVAAIVKGACGGCFRGQPPHALQEAKRRDRLLTCDGCGRLLLLPPEGDGEV